MNKQALHGDCVECGFPIYLNNPHDQVSCPFCNTINQPVTAGSSSTPWLIALAIGVGLVILAKK